MKKKIGFFVVLLFFVASAILFATDNNSQSSYHEINMILSNSKKLSDAQLSMIFDLSPDLSPTQRTMLFESNKQSATLPFAINLLVGLGIGSFIQGDSTGGIIALAGELVSFGLIVGGYTQTLNAVYSGGYYTGAEGSTMLLIGSVGLLATKIYEVMRPFKFASDYNKKLSNSLLSVSMVPVMDQEYNMGIKLAANINF